MKVNKFGAFLGAGLSLLSCGGPQNIASDPQKAKTHLVAKTNSPKFPPEPGAEFRFRRAPHPILDQRIDTENDGGIAAYRELAEKIREVAFCLLNLRIAAKMPEAAEPNVEDAKITFTSEFKPARNNEGDFFQVGIINAVPGKRPDSLIVIRVDTREHVSIAIDDGLDGNANLGRWTNPRTSENLETVLVIPHDPTKEGAGEAFGEENVEYFRQIIIEGVRALLAKRCVKPRYAQWLWNWRAGTGRYRHEGHPWYGAYSSLPLRNESLPLIDDFTSNRIANDPMVDFNSHYPYFRHPHLFSDLESPQDGGNSLHWQNGATLLMGWWE